MARMNEKGITGLVGNLIFYERNGQTYVRSKPGPRKKKKGYQPPKEVSIFTQASKHGTPILQWLKQQVKLPNGATCLQCIQGLADAADGQ